MKPDFLYNPLSQGENRLPQRAYYIPYGEKKYAVNRQVGSNERYISMNGEWKFSYFETPLDLPDSVEAIEFQDTIPVPSCWECYGYGQIQYTNINYPFPVNVPYTKTVNPVGVYSRVIDVEAMPGLPHSYMVFEGVSAALELYINGEYVGASKGSRMQAEFEVSGFLHNGANTVTVLVYTFCDGSYLEDQDCFRYHGIFRDVYILKRPQNHVRDFTVITSTDGTICVKSDADELTLTVFDCSGNVLASGKDECRISDPV